jgi:hypothetical protein
MHQPMNRLLARIALVAVPALLAAPALLLGAAGDATDAAVECIPGGGGRLQLAVSGDFDAELDWRNAGTRCDGGPRPAGDALRLMFNRDDEGLLIVIGITGLARGATGSGLLANVTVVRQGLGLFYGTLGADACIVDVEGNVAEPGFADAYRVSGHGRCAAAIEAIGREGEIRIAPFSFTGLAYWPDEDEDHGEDRGEDTDGAADD